MWQPDSSTNKCSLCSTVFSMFNRKHHCRSCGKIICDACSQSRVQWATPMLRAKNKYSHSKGDRVRVCDLCVKTQFPLMDEFTLSLSGMTGHRQLFETLEKISIHINGAFPVSATRYFYGSKTPFSRWGKYRTAQKLLRNDTFNKNSDIVRINPYERDKVALMHALHVSIANCYEMALAGFYLLYNFFKECSHDFKKQLQKRARSHKFEYAMYEDSSFMGDHVFVLLGFDLPDSFNSGIISNNIIVFDPWKKLIFYLRDAKKTLSSNLQGRMRRVGGLPVRGNLNGSDFFEGRNTEIEIEDIDYSLLDDWVDLVLHGGYGPDRTKLKNNDLALNRRRRF
ncbi:MAG: hypothetical protein GY710_17475 [Desulfobacteraceae bacterium]|nr:hypothetical protein [Desulfobacteraceae bacterium]